MNDVRAALEAVLRDTLAALDPAAATCASLARPEVAAALAGRPITIAAVGKAAAAMARGACLALGPRIVGGLVVVPGTDAQGGAPERPGVVPGTDAPLGCGLVVIGARHPVPDASSEAAGRALLALARGVPPAGALLALISGGASALAAVPVPGTALADKVATLRRLAAAGAPIRELNAARTAMSAIKGGRLAAACLAPVITLVSSDVVGDPLEIVGSGPTIGPARARSDDVAVLSAGIATLAAATVASARARVPGTCEVRDAQLAGDVGDAAVRIAESITAASPPATLIWAGETTVRLPAVPGRGGRARHLALMVARALAGRAGWSLLVAGTDGIDGTDDAAGAIVDGETWALIDDGERMLATADAGRALASVGASLVTGRTGINHADLVVAHVARGAC